MTRNRLQMIKQYQISLTNFTLYIFQNKNTLSKKNKTKSLYCNKIWAFKDRKKRKIRKKDQKTTLLIQYVILLNFRCTHKKFMKTLGMLTNY